MVVKRIVIIINLVTGCTCIRDYSPQTYFLINKIIAITQNLSFIMINFDESSRLHCRRIRCHTPGTTADHNKSVFRRENRINLSCFYNWTVLLFCIIFINKNCFFKCVTHISHAFNDTIEIH